MIDGSLNELIDQLYDGQEIVFSYQGRKYFIQGWWNKDKSESTMVLDDVSEDHEDDYIWECHAPTMNDCAETFLNAPIWHDQCFSKLKKTLNGLIGDNSPRV